MPDIQIKSDAPILAVDDDPMFQEILQFAYSLSKLDNELLVASSGQECLNILNTRKDDQKDLPAMILMDINMPGLSGIETVEKIRSSSKFQEVPIITMLSSSNEEEDVKRSLAAGANDYCEKPFDITQLKFERV